MIRRMLWRRAPFGRVGLVRTGVLLMLGASALKISQQDADRIARDTGRGLDQLTEADLRAAMQRLGIRQLSLDDDDQDAIAQTDTL
jgi:hypothetical protein